MTLELAIMTAASLGAVALILAALPRAARRHGLALLGDILRFGLPRMHRPGSAERRASGRL